MPHPSLTSVTFHSIVCHCMEDIGAKKRDLDQNLVRIAVFSVQVLYIFLLVMWHFAKPMPPMCLSFQGIVFQGMIVMASSIVVKKPCSCCRTRRVPTLLLLFSPPPSPPSPPSPSSAIKPNINKTSVFRQFQ